MLNVLLFSTLNWLLTMLGGCLILILGKYSKTMNAIALGLSAGIMLAATFFSLLLKAIELSNSIFLPIWVFLGALCIHLLNTDSKLFAAMTLHNIPEGFIVGVAFCVHPFIVASMLSIGIGIQNFPEGLAIALPYKQAGHSSFYAINKAQLSAIVEIPSAIIGYLFALYMQKALPYTLAFTAGCMLFVVVEELLPHKSSLTSISCMIGFMIMMFLDVALGI